MIAKSPTPATTTARLLGWLVLGCLGVLLPSIVPPSIVPPSIVLPRIVLPSILLPSDFHPSAFSSSAWAEDSFGTFSPSRVTAGVIDRALAEGADGYSSDEVLIHDALRESFVDSVQAQTGMIVGPENETALMLRMLKLRKAGKLDYRSSRRARRIDSALQPVAEIAARTVIDRHRISSDTLLADPRLRRELQREAEVVQPGVDAYEIRRLILGLRKKRSLRPELVLQVADWKREVTTYSIAQLRKRIESETLPTGPGIYLFRDLVGYLYIGEAANLAKRLAQHAKQSDRESLADYLESTSGEEVSVEIHAFANDSPASKVSMRRAYESELIRSRKPRLNVRP